MAAQPPPKYRLPIRAWQELNDKVGSLELRIAKLEARVIAILLLLTFLAGNTVNGLERLLAIFGG